ncbi:hypothetical protein [Bifidobacterium pseudocatenulatum]|nr:hypothetical protein [Bifidobacterium pseudocatenulatum]MCH4840792.1 hypothetical protein [Bifidobacterium pseudocatenulatum]
MSQQNEKSKQMENQNKPNRQSTSRHHGTHPPWIYGPDISDIHPRPSAKEGRTNMKMRTDVLWEPDKTDEHDRLLSRFEDDIIGLRARTVSPCEMAIHS